MAGLRRTGRRGRPGWHEIGWIALAGDSVRRDDCHPASRGRRLSPRASAAATFSSRNEIRFVPGIGTIHGRFASSQASASCPGVQPFAAIASIRSTSATLCSRFRSWKRGHRCRASLVERSEVAPDPAGEHPAPERSVGQEADAELLKEVEGFVLEAALEKRVLALQRRDRSGCSGSPDVLGRRLGEADVADLSLDHEFVHRADGLLDRGVSGSTRWSW